MVSVPGVEEGEHLDRAVSTSSEDSSPQSAYALRMVGREGEG